MTGDRVDPAGGVLGSLAGDGSLSSVAPLPLEQQGHIVGGYVWVERRVFEILGTWAESEPLVDAQLLFDMYSQQHGWHAELLTERLPVVDSLESDWASRAPSVDVERVLAELSGSLAPTVDATRTAARERHPSGGRPGGGTLLRLVGLGRVVLPRLVTGYTALRQRVSAVSDGPLARSLRFVVQDDIEQWRQIEALTQTLLRRPHDIAVVSSHQAHLEELVAERGPGLVPWPSPAAPVTAASPSEVAMGRDGPPPPAPLERTEGHETVGVPTQVSDTSVISAHDGGS